MEPYCIDCKDTCVDPDDPTGQHDCRYCGGSFAWRQREEHFRKQNDAEIAEGTRDEIQQNKRKFGHA